jgi:hypothetical protein
LLFSLLSWGSESFSERTSELTLRVDAPIEAGPVVTYVAEGFRDDPAVGREGGWFLAWTETDGSGHRLLGVRVSNSGDRALETPFVLADEALIAHPYVRETTLGHIGFAFVSGAAEQSLNIGSLACP